MPDLFADTAGWGHLVDRTQRYHAQAASVYRSRREQHDRFITSNYVLLEVVALLTSPLHIPRPKVVAFVEGLKAAPHVEIVHVDAALHERAWQLLKERQDKAWSLVDCSSSVIMQQHSLTEAFTTDPHFEQAGFIPLLGA